MEGCGKLSFFAYWVPCSFDPFSKLQFFSTSRKGGRLDLGHALSLCPTKVFVDSRNRVRIIARVKCEQLERTSRSVRMHAPKAWSFSTVEET